MDRRRALALAVALSGVGAPASAHAQREPVLKQVGLPHAYYWREMYVPQVTSGPSAVTWSPDGTELSYSMQGSLWRQRMGTTVAAQLTAGPGYDYEPDWSPDGRRVVFARYANDAIELELLDLASGTVRSLTANGAVNVEPRWSPDGSRIAFVSSVYNGQWHIFTVAASSGEITRLTEDNDSRLPRYYYSTWDHYISPAWSPDGRELLIVSNRGHIHGTGGFWRMDATPGAPLREIRYEETTWKARPDWSPDGTRVVYSSYLGRQWNQLWLMPGDGGDVFPLTYGEFDATAPRWSRDGRHIAYISNEGGNTSLWIMDVPGARRQRLVVADRRYREPVGRLRVVTVDGAGRPSPARVSVTTADGRSWAPDDAWRHADEAFDRSERPYRNSPSHLAFQARAEDLHLVEDLVVNKEQRIPDIAYFRTDADPVSTPGFLLVHGQEYHTSYWGHTAFLGLTDHYLLPEYAGYPNTAAASLWPTNADVADLAHAQSGGALVGYVHPFDARPDPADTTQPLTHELPADVALGKVDYLEVMGYSDHLITSEIWYRLLNCGFRLPAGAGTDAFPNFASLRGPPGLVRVFVHTGATLDHRRWLAGIKAGRTFVTNAPLLEFTLGGRAIGDAIRLPPGGGRLTARVVLRSSVPVDHLEIVGNGRIAATIPLAGDRRVASDTVSIPITRSGWYVVRAYGDGARLPILDLYPFGSTSPIYVQVGDAPVRSREDAEFFMRWIDRLAQAARAHTGWNTAAEREGVLKMLADARAVYEERTR